MGILDKARDVAKQAGDMASKAVDEVKEKGQGFQLQRKVNSLAEELGHIAYRQKTGEQGLDAEVDRLVAEITQAKVELEAVEQE
jgi:seryl-tRNA synthetase